MDRLLEMVLVIGIIFLSAYSMKLSNDTMVAVEKWNQSIQLMFVKS
jgi:hypothetical protein